MPSQGQGAVGEILRTFDYRALPLESAYGHYPADWPSALLGSSDASAPAAIGRGRAEPAFTTWKHRPPAELCRVIDYIWFTKGGVAAGRLESQRRLPS